MGRIRRCGLVRGSVSLGVGFKVSKAHTVLSSVCFMVLLQDISYCPCYAWLFAVILPAVMVMNPLEL